MLWEARGGRGGSGRLGLSDTPRQILAKHPGNDLRSYGESDQFEIASRNERISSRHRRTPHPRRGGAPGAQRRPYACPSHRPDSLVRGRGCCRLRPHPALASLGFIVAGRELRAGYDPAQDEVLKILGLSLIASQGVERLLSLCMTFVLRDQPLETVDEMNGLVAKHSRATLGTLLKLLRSRVVLEPESARDLRRLQPLRRWSHEQVEQVLT